MATHGAINSFRTRRPFFWSHNDPRMVQRLDSGRFILRAVLGVFARIGETTGVSNVFFLFVFYGHLLVFSSSSFSTTHFQVTPPSQGHRIYHQESRVLYLVSYLTPSLSAREGQPRYGPP
ncbi:hypothetical protein LZ32DRAFT_4400 [Colletotrichum eremochloae]|nr:hypothetical protein LZ32DRAFT_4400 [Colletotrichum eremochloae]